MVRFEVANNWIFSSGENHVMTSGDHVWPAAWIFDCEAAALAAAAKLNKTEAKYGRWVPGRVNAVACIID